MKKRILSTLFATVLAFGVMPISALATATAVTDPNPPTLESISIDKHEVGIGGTVTIAHSISDVDGVRSVSPNFMDGNPADIDLSSSFMQAGFAVASGDADPSKTVISDITSLRAGQHIYLTGLTIQDKAGYVTNILDKTYAEKTNQQGPTADLSAIHYEVIGKRETASSPTYSTLNGNNSTYTLGSNKELEFRFDGPLEQFDSLEINGKTVPQEHYSLRTGSTIVSIKPSYLEALDAGTHQVTARYSDGGTATASFTITAANTNSNPEKEDGTNDGNPDQDTNSNKNNEANPIGTPTPGNTTQTSTNGNTESASNSSAGITKTTADTTTIPGKDSPLVKTGDKLAPVISLVIILGLTLLGIVLLRRQSYTER